MRKIILSIVGSMLISICAVQAQQTDREGAAERERNKQQNKQSEQTRQRDGTRMDRDRWQQQSDKSQSQDNYANEGMVIIDKSEIPPSLKQTLQQEKYQGWENGTIYHNTNTGEYVIAPRAYRFDENGKEMEMQDAASGYGYREQRSSRYPDQQSDRMGQSQTERQSQDQMDERSDAASQNQNGNQDQARNRDGYQSNPNQTDQSQGQEQSRTDRSDQASDQSRQPSSGYRSGQEDRVGAGTQTQPGQSGREQYSTEGMTEVQTEQIPASLRRTLNQSQYRGWEENGTLYQDPSTNEYVLVMEKTGNATAPQTYRFDKNGQAKEGDDNGRAQSKRDQQ